MPDKQLQIIDQNQKPQMSEMSLASRSILALLVIVGALVISSFLDIYFNPTVSTKAALARVNGGYEATSLSRFIQQNIQYLNVFVFLVALLILSLLFKKELHMLATRMGKMGSVLVIAVGLFSMPGCKPYNAPVYEVVENHETAFVVPLEGELADQVKFASAETLESHRVAIQRIQIPRRWNPTGRFWYEGEWIPTVRVLRVDCSPVAGTWQSEKVGQGNGIWIESRDSVGFSTGFSIVAAVDKKDASKFLYQYRGNSLKDVMNGEIRARVQSIASEVASRYTMDNLREKKEEMIMAIKADIIPFFHERGINITTVGNFGGFSYENPAIQNSIDNVFVAQQEKNVAAAQLSAQRDKNERLKQEGRGEADKMREIASGQKDAAITAAEGESQRIRMVAEATKEAGQYPLFLQMRMLDVQTKGIERWDGKYPVTMMTFGAGEAPKMLLQMPQFNAK